MNEATEAIKVLNIDHLGIVAGIIDEMELVEEVNKGILPKHLNDDRLGRALDKYYQTGTTKLFTAIALKAAHKFQVKMNSIHLDGSSMYVHGAYKNESEAINEIEKETSETDKQTSKKTVRKRESSTAQAIPTRICVSSRRRNSNKPAIRLMEIPPHRNRVPRKNHQKTKSNSQINNQTRDKKI